MRCTFFGAWAEDSGNLPDLSNLYQMPEDLLQYAGVIEDDRLIAGHDGSRRVCLCSGPCPKRGKKKSCGAKKKCPFARVEIVLFAYKGGTMRTPEEQYLDMTPT